MPGVKRLIEELCRRDIPHGFLSNNPTKDPHLYVEKLARLNIPTPLADIVNTVVTMASWLKVHLPLQLKLVPNQIPGYYGHTWFDDAEVALASPEVKPSRCVMVGDRLYIDIKWQRKTACIRQCRSPGTPLWKKP